MEDFNKDYYFVRRPKGRDELPSLSPDVNTEDRTFRFEAQTVGSPPLVFVNSSAEYDRQHKIKPTKNLRAILFDGTNLIIKSPIRERLIAFDIPNISLHPAIYIDDRKKWHEDYWYVTFTSTFDCWDRDLSDYEKDEPPIEMGGFELHQVYTYVLNEVLLRKTSLRERLLFKMGGVLPSMVVCHKSIVGIFSGDEKSGANVQRVSDY